MTQERSERSKKDICWSLGLEEDIYVYESDVVDGTYFSVTDYGTFLQIKHREIYEHQLVCVIIYYEMT